VLKLLTIDRRLNNLQHAIRQVEHLLWSHSIEETVEYEQSSLSARIDTANPGESLKYLPYQLLVETGCLQSDYDDLHEASEVVDQELDLLVGVSSGGSNYALVNKEHDLFAEHCELAFETLVVAILGDVVDGVLDGYHVPLADELLVENFADAAVHDLDELVVQEVTLADLVQGDEEILDGLDSKDDYSWMLVSSGTLEEFVELAKTLGRGANQAWALSGELGQKYSSADLDSEGVVLGALIHPAHHLAKGLLEPVR
jgi:hypothetical protein